MPTPNPPYQGDHYEPGNYWMVCDVCGRKYRRADMRARWDNAWVCLEDWEIQHPQEHLRGKMEEIGVPVARPEQTIISIGPGDVTPGDL